VQSQNHKLRVVQDGTTPIVIGNCPACHAGENTMILVDFKPSRNPDNGLLKLRCIVCFNIHMTRICEVTEE